MSNLPSHASPYLAPHALRANGHIPAFALNSGTSTPSLRSSTADGFLGTENPKKDHHHILDNVTPQLPESIISPAFTPPATPGGTINLHTSQPVDNTQRTSSGKLPKLVERLPQVECVVRARIPTTSGAEMFLHLYQNDVDNKEHLAIVFGNNIRSRSLDRVREGETEMDRMIRGAYVGRLHPGRVNSRVDDAQQPHSDSSETPSETTPIPMPIQAQGPLVRIHSECYTGETAWSARCDCGEQLDEAARLMSMPSSASNDDATAPEFTTPDDSTESLGGVIIYLRQEGRGIGLGEKLKAYNLQDLGSDTVEANLLLRHPADARSYGLATAMLVDLGLGADSLPQGIRLLTNNPDKIHAVEGPKREVIVKERVPMIPIAWRTGGKRGIKSTEIEGYLRTKVRHLLSRLLLSVE
jgi:GTP cyclohydrolase II